MKFIITMLIIMVAVVWFVISVPDCERPVQYISANKLQDCLNK